MSRELHCSQSNPNRFLTLEPEASGEGTALSLHALPDAQPGRLALVTRHVAPGYIRCLAWHPASERVAAAGLLNGAIRLVSPFPDQPGPAPAPGLGPWGSELAGVKHPRQVLALAWNPANLWLAAGFDRSLLSPSRHLHSCPGTEQGRRHRSEKGVSVWDLSDAAYASGEASVSSYGSLRRKKVWALAPPLYLSQCRRSCREATVGRPCLTWPPVKLLTPPSGCETYHLSGVREECKDGVLCQSNRTLAAGLSGKYIRLFDLRSDPARHSLSLPTKACFGISQCPTQVLPYIASKCDNSLHIVFSLQENQLLSYDEKQVFLWDLRSGKGDKPIFSITESKPIVKVN